MHSDATSSTAAAMAVDIRRFPWIRRLASDYAFAFDRVAPFFAGAAPLAAGIHEEIKTMIINKIKAITTNMSSIQKIFKA